MEPGISLMAKTLLPLPLRVFPNTWLNINPLLSGNDNRSDDLILPKSDPLSPEKKSTEKKARSLART